MIAFLPDDLAAGREMHRGGVTHDAVQDQQLALAWARLADSVAPPNTSNPDRVLVVRAFSVSGGAGTD